MIWIENAAHAALIAAWVQRKKRYELSRGTAQRQIIAPSAGRGGREGAEGAQTPKG